jgi:hypothetical protein
MHLDRYLPKRICKPKILSEITRMLIQQGKWEWSLMLVVLLHNNIWQIKV